MEEKDNGEQLRELIEAAGITQAEALKRFNKRQVRPISVGHWKAYLARIDSARRYPCPDFVLKRSKKLFANTA